MASIIELEKDDIHLKLLFENRIDIKSRRVQLVGEVNTEMFILVDAALSYFERKGRGQVTFAINSHGGFSSQALAIVGRMKRSSCKIVTEGYGEIESAATLILAAGDIRRISKFAMFMHHEGSESIDGRTSQILNKARAMEADELRWAEFMAEMTNRDAKYWFNKGVGVDYYMTPEELLDSGVVDKII